MTQRLRAAQSEDGFSLIELLIVIVILGVLSGIVVFGVGTFRGDADAAACQADVKAYNVAKSAYKVKFPTSTPNESTLVGAGYLESASACPGTD